MSLDIGTLIRAAALGGTSYVQGRQDRETRQKQEREESQKKLEEQAEAARNRAREDAEDQREALEHALRMRALEESMRPKPPTPPSFNVSGGGISTKVDDLQEALRLRGILNPPDPTEQASGNATSGLADFARAGIATAPQESESTRQFMGVPLPFGERQTFQGAPGPDAQNAIDLLSRANDIRRRLVGSGETDRAKIEGEVRRGLESYIRQMVISEGFRGAEIEAEVKRRLQGG